MAIVDFQNQGPQVEPLQREPHAAGAQARHVQQLFHQVVQSFQVALCRNDALGELVFQRSARQLRLDGPEQRSICNCIGVMGVFSSWDAMDKNSSRISMASRARP